VNFFFGTLCPDRKDRYLSVICFLLHLFPVFRNRPLAQLPIRLSSKVPIIGTKEGNARYSGQKTDPLSASGGGEVDVASFAILNIYI